MDVRIGCKELEDGTGFQWILDRRILDWIRECSSDPNVVWDIDDNNTYGRDPTQIRQVRRRVQQRFQTRYIVSGKYMGGIVTHREYPFARSWYQMEKAFIDLEDRYRWHQRQLSESVEDNWG